MTGKDPKQVAATKFVPVLWGMLTALLALALALLLTGQIIIGIALIVVAVSLAIVAMNMGKNNPGSGT